MTNTDTSVGMTLERIAADIAWLAEEAARSDAEVADVAHLLSDLRAIKKDAARAYDEVERALLSLMGERKQEIPGLGVVEVKGSPRRTKWRHDELIPVIVSRALDERVFDPETGEAQEREAETVARVLRECISFGAGKVTGLRARGIQPDEYCQEDEMHYSIVLPPAVER